MIIDHLGLFFFPHIFLFRFIGRLAFPLFSWLIANGARHTHNINKYLLRLYLFALISQIPFLLANKLTDPTFRDLNVLCTLFFGLAAIVIIQKSKNWIVWIVITILCAAIAQYLQTDYGGFGVAVIVVFYLFFNNFRQLVIAQILLFFAPLFLLPDYMSGLIEPIGLFSLVFIKFYNNKPGPSAKYLFYLFYPLQYVVFYFLLLKLLGVTG